MNEISSAPYAHSRLTRSVRITVAGQRWDDNVKAVAWVAAMGARVREQRNNFKHFRERARPPMDERQRNGTWSLSFLVNKMKLEPFDLGTKMAESIQLCFLKPPIKLLFPISGEFLKIREISTLVPSRIRNFFWPSSAGEPLLQIHQICFWGTYLKFFYIHDAWS